MVTYFTFSGSYSLFAWFFGLPLMAFFMSFFVPAWFATDGIADTAPDGVDWAVGIAFVLVDILCGLVMLAGRRGAGPSLIKSLAVLLIVGTGVVVVGYKYLPTRIQVNLPDLNFDGVDDRQRFHASSLDANPPPLVSDVELETAYYVPDKARFERAVDRFVEVSEKVENEKRRVSRAWQQGQTTAYNYPEIFRGDLEQETEWKKAFERMASKGEYRRREFLEFEESYIYPLLFGLLEENLTESRGSMSVRVVDNNIILEGLEGRRGGFLVEITGSIYMQEGSHPRADEGYFYIQDQQLDWVVYGDITEADREKGMKMLPLSGYPLGHAVRRYESDKSGLKRLAMFIKKHH
ncbi:hypothetical protein [Alcanivorax jadensis]|uniref:hypothetical protein n=1 Tax=Alcanivorax jadensis TaxID=64988 RepID=UPI003569C36E